MSDDDDAVPSWDAFPFDEEVTFESIPTGSRPSAMYVSIAPEPPYGCVRVLGKMANGAIGSVTIAGRVYAAKLPFADRVIRLQHLGGTRSVALELTSFAS